MKTVNGDLIQLAKTGHFDVIVHGCNCFCRMRSGIAKQIADEFPEVEKADGYTDCGDPDKLGTILDVTVENLNGDNFVVVNAYTQFRYGRDKRYADYEAIRSCFRIIKIWFKGKRIGYPKIGAGLAGGDWNVISKIIDEELEGEDHTLVLFGG